MKTLNFVVIKLTLCLVSGILLEHFLKFTLNWILISTAILLLNVTICFVNKKTFNKSIWFGILTYLLMINLGMLTHAFHNEVNFKDHYTKFNLKASDEHQIKFEIIERLKPTQFNEKYIVKVIDAGKVEIE